MRTDPRPEEVRRLVARVLDELSEPWEVGGGRWEVGSGRSSHYIPHPTSHIPQPGLEMDETILIDEGRYVARSYKTDGFLAMWLVEIGIVQFYNDEGDMLCTVNLFESLEPQRVAA